MNAYPIPEDGGFPWWLGLLLVILAVGGLSAALEYLGPVQYRPTTLIQSRPLPKDSGSTLVLEKCNLSFSSPTSKLNQDNLVNDQGTVKYYIGREAKPDYGNMDVFVGCTSKNPGLNANPTLTDAANIPILSKELQDKSKKVDKTEQTDKVSGNKYTMYIFNVDNKYYQVMVYSPVDFQLDYYRAGSQQKN